MTFFITLTKRDGYTWALMYSKDRDYIERVFDDIAVPDEYETAELCSTTEDIDTYLTCDTIRTKKA